MSSVIDLDSRRETLAPMPVFEHPAGVVLPSDSRLLPGLIAPELRAAISKGEFDADMIALLSDVLREGDRVLVIGDGLGLISTLIAKNPIVADVIATEADAALIPYLRSVHAQNGVPWLETINAFPVNAARGRVPYFARRDPRQSSLRPEDGNWLRVSMTPLVDLDLLLAETQVSLVVWSCAASAASALAEADLRWVERILLHRGNETGGLRGETAVPALLEREGFVASDFGETVLLRRSV